MESQGFVWEEASTDPKRNLMKPVLCGSRSLIKKEFCLFFIPKVEMNCETQAIWLMLDKLSLIAIAITPPKTVWTP